VDELSPRWEDDIHKHKEDLVENGGEEE